MTFTQPFTVIELSFIKPALRFLFLTVYQPKKIDFMRFVYFAAAMFAMLPATTMAQSFVNGSFESTNAAPASCNYLQNAGLSTYTNGADTGYGTADNITYISAPNAYCQIGDADDGKVYISLTSNQTKFDAIAMKVSPALQIGKHYVITFKYKATMSGPAVSMNLGYSTTNKTDGTLIALVPTPANADTVWKPQTYSFSPTTAASWITLKANLSTFLGYSFLELDNFKIQNAESIEDAHAEAVFSLSPNPATGFTVISTNSNQPITVAVTDMTGRTLSSGKYIPQNGHVKISLSDLPTGLYLVNIANGTDKATQKLQIIQ
jgi:hypothetical protein